MIYSRMGAGVTLIRPVKSAKEAAELEKRKPDKLDQERVSYGQYYVCRFFNPETEEEWGGDRLVDLALCRADGGIHEIHEAAREVGGHPI